MGIIINGYDLDDVFKGAESTRYHSCTLHNVHEHIITEKGKTCQDLEWFLCHLYDKPDKLVDDLINTLIKWRLK
jgi:hypothetical protein